jgi:hypothetical protein
MNDIDLRPPKKPLAKRLQPCAILLAILLLFWVYGEPVYWLVQAKSEAKKTPALWNVPQPLHLQSSQPTTGKMLSYLGYQFQPPWGDIVVERKSKEAVVLSFSGGQGLAIFDESNIVDKRNNAEQPENKQREQFIKALFGYAFRSKVLTATPADLHWSLLPRRMEVGPYFLRMKALDVRFIKGGVFSFQTPSFQGFQLGGPSQEERDPVSIEFYDADAFKIKMFIGNHNDAARKFTQADLDQIISTLQPVPPVVTK